MPKEYDREQIDELLSAAKERQNCEIDGNTIATHDVDSLIALAEGDDSEG